MNTIDTSRFTGTEAYHRLPLWGIVLTDGAKFVADRAGAYWLMDEIGARIMERGARSNPSRMANGFFVVKLTVEDDNRSLIRFEDGNGGVITTQRIPYTNYPDPELELFVQYGGPGLGWVVMVPSEY